MINEPSLPELDSDDLLPGPYLEIRFGPGWNYVSTVRSFLHEFLLVTFKDQKKSDRISMALSELLENAVKYSTGNHAYIRIQIAENQGDVRVEVMNHSNEILAAELEEVLQRINAMEPLEAYMMMMQESGAQSSGSRLGLARIRYEARGELSSQFVDGRVLMKAYFC